MYVANHFAINLCVFNISLFLDDDNVILFSAESISNDANDLNDNLSGEQENDLNVFIPNTPTDNPLKTNLAKRKSTEELMLDTVKRDKMEQEAIRYACTYEGCKRNYKTKANLRRHVRDAHLGIVYSCEYDDCIWKHPTKKGLKHHILRVHQGIRFTCEYDGCGVEYKSKYALQSHIREIHEEVHREVHCRWKRCSEQFRYVYEHSLSQLNRGTTCNNIRIYKENLRDKHFQITLQ